MPRVDRDIYAMLEHDLPGARFYPFTELWREGMPVTAGQTWLSTRFHAHLMAAAAGADGVALPVSADYYRPKHDSLIALGSGWTVATGWADDEGWTPPARPTNGGFPADVVRDHHQRKIDLAHHIYGPPATSERTGALRLRRRTHG